MHIPKGASPLVLPGVPLARRVTVLGVLCTGIVTLGLIAVSYATNNSWVVEGEIDGLVNSEDAESQPNNDCEDYINIFAGNGPGWARVGGSIDPHAGVIRVTGQILDPQQFISFLPSDAIASRFKTNAFVNYTDYVFNHFARDVNTFLTLDPEHRHFLTTRGSFVEGDSNELGNFEIEWERGAIPMYAFPALGDRMTVWGPHIFDCGHGDTWVEVGPDDDDTYRTEIHPPYGWVIYRQTADADAQPDGDKRLEHPWRWYHDTDLQGQAASFPASGLLFTDVQATVADAYFSSYGGNTVEALNGCEDGDDPDLQCQDYEFRPELSGNEDIDSWEWANPILDMDYAFVVPAPPLPEGAPADVEMIWDVEDHCPDVPANPSYPNKFLHDGDDVEGGSGIEAYYSDRPIGLVGACNPAPGGNPSFTVEVDRDGSAPWNDTGMADTELPPRPAIRFTVRAKTGKDGIDGNADDPTYPANDYISFAYRVKVGWDYAPAEDDRARRFRVDFDTLHVFNDGEFCDDDANTDPDDGEWVMSLRVNEQYIHPVFGTAADDNDFDMALEPFFEDEAIDDKRCALNGEGEGGPKDYEMGSPGTSRLSRHVVVLPWQQIEIWERTYDKEPAGQDDTLARVVRAFFPQPPLGGSSSHTIGTANINESMSHTIDLAIVDATLDVPDPGTLEFGTPTYGPNAFTEGRTRVSGATPASVDAGMDAMGLEWRLWPVGEAPPAWQFDLDASDGLTIDLPDDISCICNLEWATIAGSGSDQIVSERERETIELDNEPPSLFLPGSFSVYANQTAGARVVYSATATDNFPGPIDVVCIPPSGEIFPNGANGPRVTTVSCTATDTVENESSGTFDVTVVSPHGYVNDYVLLGIEWLEVGGEARIESGSAGAFDQSSGIPGQPGVELRLQNDVRTTAQAAAAAHSVVIGADLHLGEVFSVTPLVAGPDSVFVSYPACDPSQAAGPTKCAYVPLWSGLPAFIDPGPAGADQNIQGQATLAPGNYGALELKSNAVLTLQAGSYSFTSVSLSPGSRIVYGSPPPTVRVAGRVEVKSVSAIEPVGGAPPRLALYVRGADQPPNKPVFDVGSGSQVQANVYARNGTVGIGNGSTLSGAFIGRWVRVGSGTTVSKDSIFLLP